MIEASFDRTRSAAVSGAYQYDTGQRLRLHGLPSPDELSQRDDFISGDSVCVQVQYAFIGDERTESRIAIWDDEEGVWVAGIPDEYMRRNEDVSVYVYVGYGQTQESMRAKTMYEAVFRPIARPAPSNSVTPDQVNEWDALVQEVSLALTNMGTAASNANAAAVRAGEAAGKIDNMQVIATTLPEGSDAMAEIEDKGSYKQITFGIPQGKTGPQGVPGVFSINGKPVTNNTDLVLTAGDVGAREANGALTATYNVVVPFNQFTEDEDGWFTLEISVSGIRASDNPIADLQVFGYDPETTRKREESWALIKNIETADGKIVLYAQKDPRVFAPSLLITIRLLVFR